jgi:elongation factor G
MKIYRSDNLRNVVLLGHGGAGKTSLAEAMLYRSGAVNRLGRVDDGTSVADWDDEERRRQMSINTSLIPCEWADHKLNVIDTPGYMDFVGEVISGIRVADAAVVVLDSTGGVEVGTEQVWHYATERDLPRLAFVNKMERENVDYAGVVDQIAAKFDVVAVPIFLPIGSQADFKGVVDVLAQKAYMGEEGNEAPIPGDLADAVEEARMVLIEAAAEGEDSLMEKYFEEETLSDDEIMRGLKARINRGSVVPVLCGSAAMTIGIKPLMQTIIKLMPSPVEAGPYEAVNPTTNAKAQLNSDSAAELAVLVFKTVADPYVGKLSYFRTYSGTLESDSSVHK